MPQTLETVRPKALPLPGARVVARIRRLLVFAGIGAVVYSILTTASRSTCVGGYDTAGGYVNASGDSTDVVPACIDLTMRPSPLIYLAVVVIILWVLGRVVKEQTQDAAIRVLDRTGRVIGILFLASCAVALTWFFMIPIEQWNPTGSSTFFFPFPFGSVEMQTTPMPDVSS